MERLEDEPGDFIDSRDLFKPEPLPFCSTWRFDPRTIEKDMVVVQRCYRLIREQPAPKFCALVEHYLLIYENYDTGCVVDLCHVKFLKIKKAKENTTNSRKMNHFSIGHSSGTKVVLHFGVLGKTFEQWAAAFKDVVYSHLVEDVTDTSFLDVSTTKRVAALRPRDFNESSFFIEPEDKENNGFLKRVGSRFKKKRSKSSAQSCDRFNDSKMTDFNGTLNTTVLFNKTDPCFSKSLDVSHAVDKKAFYKRGPFKWMSKKKNWDASSGFDSVDAGNCSTISSFKSDIIPSKTPRRNSICFDPVVVEIPPSKFDPVDNDSGIFTSDSHSPDEQEHSPSPPTPQYNLSLPLFKMEEVYPRIQIDLSADIKRLCEDEFPGSSQMSPDLKVAREAVLVRSSAVPEGTPEIRGFDFNSGVDFARLMDTYLTTGCQATNLGRAVEEVNKMIEARKEEPQFDDGVDTMFPFPEGRRKRGCTIFIGYTSNLISSGLREVIRFLVEHDMVDCIVTSAGGVEEDLIKCLAPSYLGDFHLSGAELRKEGLNRAGNVLIPNDNYCKFEDWLMPILDECAAETRFWTPAKLIDRLGERIAHRDSICYWAHRNRIPIFCPALTDGSLGDMLYFHSIRSAPGILLDIVEDVRHINTMAVKSVKSGVIILGGGVVKHHINNANLMRNGSDFTVFINTGQEFDGSDSGARPDEAVSWGKVKTTSRSVKVFCDATLVFPLVVARTFVRDWEKNEEK